MKKDSILRDKSYSFAIRIVRLSQFLQNKKEFILSNQVLRSGTAIGALIKEAEYAQSKPDFINKLNIALKEANETAYIEKPLFESLFNECDELICMLVSSIKTLKMRPNPNS